MPEPRWLVMAISKAISMNSLPIWRVGLQRIGRSSRPKFVADFGQPSHYRGGRT